MTMLERFKEPLINPTWEQIVERDPLMAFSHYLSGRVHLLLALKEETLEHLESGFSGKHVDGGRVGRAESLKWLWILGAYEVVWTMCQAKGYFSDSMFNELALLKKALSAARMPAAKMEKVGKRKPVNSNRSPSGWDVSTRDLLVSDTDEKPDISARFMLAEFDRVFSSMTKYDVLARHEESYE